MKAADADRQASGEEWSRQIDGARKLVRLHAHESDQRPPARPADFADDPVGPDPPVGFVKGLEADFDARAEHLTPGGVSRERIQARQRIGRDDRLDPLDRIAVVVVMRRLDQHEPE